MEGTVGYPKGKQRPHSIDKTSCIDIFFLTHRSSLSFKQIINSTPPTQQSAKKIIKKSMYTGRNCKKRTLPKVSYASIPSRTPSNGNQLLRRKRPAEKHHHHGHIHASSPSHPLCQKLWSYGICSAPGGVDKERVRFLDQPTVFDRLEDVREETGTRVHVALVGGLCGGRVMLV